MITETIPAAQVGAEPLATHADANEPQTVTIDGDRFVAIDNAEQMPPFFLTMVSATNHWFFASSQGALTAGRGSPDTALFPYYTVDKIMDNWNTTGPQTVVQIEGVRWEPFMPYAERQFTISRRLLKSFNSDSLVFEETNHTLQLRFSYRWRTSEKFGFVRTATIVNLATEERELAVVDGLENFLPAGLDERTQNVYSCLGDAYKLTEIDAATSLLVHRMASGLTDEAAPMEVLRATTVWSHGWPESSVFGQRKSALQWLEGEDPAEPMQIRATRGAYYNAGRMVLAPREQAAWRQVAEIQQTQAQAATLRAQLSAPDALWESVCEDIDHGSQKLEELISSSDGCQLTADSAYCAHHRSNVLFNIMRGGVFADNYNIDRELLKQSIRSFKRELCDAELAWLDKLPEAIGYPDLIAQARQGASADLLRLCQEHLPLIFSRRHGDPSRPWNKFNIQTKDAQGRDVVGFEGNWRDIYQNWEALAYSFPHFNEAFLRKFLNASTADGYNPYRITARGVDWEKPDPNDPWASIGYWGDHQLIYLLKFLEFAESFDGDGFRAILQEAGLVFADVPYEIKSFAELARDPNHSIHFNVERDAAIAQRAAKRGADGKLVHDASGELRHAGFMEKLLIPALVKLGNYCPNGGIWMNTQRPEWNDANNALAGWGLSMVTTAYLYRYLRFLQGLVTEHTASYLCSEAVAEFLASQTDLFTADANACGHDDAQRYLLLSALGEAGEQYRTRVYAGNFGSQSKIDSHTIAVWIERVLAHLETALRDSQRNDGLYHAYNTLLLDVDAQMATVEHLGEMLEGQVAVLSAGVLSPQESIAVLESLQASRLYCPRRNSYILYADKELPAFLDMGRVAMEDAKAIPLLAQMLEQGERSLIEESDSEGLCRFNSRLANRFELDEVLESFASQSEWGEAVVRDRKAVHALYEATFNHQAFTGRSGSMFAYEGLGSIYWHMVSKLMLAVAEIAQRADTSGDAAYPELVRYYYAVQDGLGFRKSPHDYGAFPADAYSHTPAHAGAQQPGLTGMVKEGVLARFAELGVRYEARGIRFYPRLLRTEEFLTKEDGCRVLGVDGAPRALSVPKQGLLFTLAQTPIIYQRTERETALVQVCHSDGSVTVIHDSRLPRGVAAEIIGRTGAIDHVVVKLPA
ncbi:hypothetical protein [Cerasicoccus maritimus]|uniref:hypothetical protein n=1 Tax=Cerasicoccus maritimus TaxID=490089 RepID=UPI002852D1ED|nr:hypothetical protein [Cerasicoccus maritimus]